MTPLHASVHGHEGITLSACYVPSRLVHVCMNPCMVFFIWGAGCDKESMSSIGNVMCHRTNGTVHAYQKGFHSICDHLTHRIFPFFRSLRKQGLQIRRSLLLFESVHQRVVVARVDFPTEGSQPMHRTRVGLFFLVGTPESDYLPSGSVGTNGPRAKGALSVS